jgi:hypothetical protein
MTDQTSTDWRTLEAGLALDRLIAAQLGWTEIEETEYWIEDEYDSYQRKRLDGRRPGYGDDIIPLYSTNLNAAIDLLEQIPMGALFMADDFAETRLWNCTGYMDGFGILTDETAATSALAICRAWLAYKERHS